MQTLRRNKATITSATIIALLVLTVSIFSSSGWRMYPVEGGSMRPTFEVGTIIFTKPVQVSELQQFDIITYHDPRTSRVTTHTFIGFEEDGSLQTRGDANPTADRHTPSLTQEHLIGKVWASSAIPLRSLDFWLTTPKGLAILGVMAIMLFIWRSDVHKRKKHAMQQANAQKEDLDTSANVH